MTLYSDLRKQEIANTGFSSGLTVTQQAFQNVTQNSTVTVTHDEDSTSSRVVQVVEFKPGEESLVDTTLDFDLSDEGDFIQEDSSIGTDFVDGKIFLHKTIGDYNEQQKIQASDKEAGDQFGHSVSIYGDTAIVGARYEDTGGSDAGAAYIFTRSGSTWTQQQKIQASDKEASDQFGFSVSIYGDTAIVGAYLEDTGGSNAGAAYIFTRSGSTWTQQQKIQASDKEAGDQFGFSVSIYGDTAVVGSFHESTGGSYAGAAYIFTRSGSTWTQQQKIQASDKEAGDQFGHSVSVYEDTVIVGAWREDTGGNDAGAAYIFTRSGSTWTQQQKIQASDKEADDWFGFSVSIYGDTAIVGAHYEDTGGSYAGAAYIFTRSGSTWTQQQKIQASDKESGDLLGYSVSICGDIITVGACKEDTGDNNAGAAYIFTRSGSTWTQQQKIQASDKEADDQFGFSVSIYGDTVIVGALYEDTGGTDAGAAYIFSSITYPTTPYYVTTSDSNHLFLGSVAEINSCTVTNTSPTNTTIKCLVSFDSRSTWKKWGGSSWETHAGGLSNLQTGNTIAELQTGFTNLTIASGIDYLDFAFDLGTTDSGITPSVDLITVNYDEKGYYQPKPSDYEIEYCSSITTKVTKNSAGAKNIKVNVVI